MEPKSLSILSVIMLGISALSFLIMHVYESQIAGWSAVVFGFGSITIMIISGLRKLKDDKIAKSQN